jgi:YggT family protein
MRFRADTAMRCSCLVPSHCPRRAINANPFTLGATPPTAASGSVPAGRTGGMLSLIQILLLILDVVWFVMIAHIIMSWLINFQVLNLRQPLVSQIWYGLNRLLEPLYRPIRRILPDLGGIDLAPLVALIAVYALRIIIINNAAAFV